MFFLIDIAKNILDGLTSFDNRHRSYLANMPKIQDGCQSLANILSGTVYCYVKNVTYLALVLKYAHHYVLY